MATITVTDLAVALDTDARTARKFLRAITPKDAQPGKGSRWVIEAKQVRSMKAQFKKFEQAANEASQAREVAKAEKATEAPDEVEGEVTEPTAEDLEAIDAE